MKTNFTSFGVQVKTKLLEMGKDQKWLQKETSDLTGLYVDSGYMYKIFTGKRNAPKVVNAIKEILELET